MDEKSQITPSDTRLEQDERATGHQQITKSANTRSTGTESSSAEQSTEWRSCIKNYLTRRVEEFFQIEMPKRIRYLNAILEKPTFAEPNCTRMLNIGVAERKQESTKETAAEMPSCTHSGWSSVAEHSNLRFRVLPSGDVECKQHIFELRFVVYPFVKTLREDINLLQTWIVEPKMPDEYFVKSINEDTLVEIEALEAEVSALSTQLCQFREKRSKVESKVDMEPHNEDYRHQIVEMDKKECLRFGKMFRVIRNRYCMLYAAFVETLKTSKGKPLN